MTHAEFVDAYARGEVRVNMDPKAAARFLSGRLLLPFITLPVLGIGVALTLVEWIYTGLGVIALAIIVPTLIKRSAPRFLLQDALDDKRLYEELVGQHVLKLVKRDG